MTWSSGNSRSSPVRRSKHGANMVGQRSRPLCRYRLGCRRGCVAFWGPSATTARRLTCAASMTRPSPGSRGSPFGRTEAERAEPVIAGRRLMPRGRSGAGKPLNERLARAEERLSRLEITRETVAEILGGAGTDEATVREAEPAAADPAAPGSPVGVVTVPPWRAGLALSASYRTCWRSWPRLGGRCGPEHRRCGRAEYRQVQDRGAAVEAETAGGTRLASRGRARAVHAAPPRCA